jgi:hypothetical protein
LPGKVLVGVDDVVVVVADDVVARAGNAVAVDASGTIDGSARSGVVAASSGPGSATTGGTGCS